MKIRLALAFTGLLALAACNEPENTTVPDNLDLNVSEIANVVEPEAPATNVSNAAIPEAASNASADAQTQEDAVATGMTSRVDRANETEAQ
jgi:hypothetical protein